MSDIYCAVAEFQAWPTGLDLQDLISGAPPDAQATELGMLLLSASRYVEAITLQPLYCRAVTDPPAQAGVGPGGRLQVRLASQFAQAVTAAQWMSSTLGGWNSIPPANCHIYGQLLAQYWADGVSPVTSWGRPPVLVMTQYTAGFPNPMLAANATAGTDSFLVDDATGLTGAVTVANLTLPGTALTLYDSTGGGRENVTVSSVSAQTVTLTAPLAFSHPAGVRASAVPYAVTQAAVFVASRYLKEKRAGASLVLGAGALESLQADRDPDIALLRDLLRPYIRRI